MARHLTDDDFFIVTQADLDMMRLAASMTHDDIDYSVFFDEDED